MDDAKVWPHPVDCPHSVGPPSRFTEPGWTSPAAARCAAQPTAVKHASIFRVPSVMASDTPRLQDLVTVLYRPRETMRRILGSTRRWAAEIAVLAFICSSLPDKDPRYLTAGKLQLPLGSAIALIVAGVLLGALFCVLGLHLVAWLVTFVSRRLGGVGNARDVRAALAWSLVPMVWSVIFRIPEAIYALRFPADVEGTPAILAFVRQGGCTVAVVVLTLKLAMFVWMLFIASSTVGEAMQLSNGQALTAVGIVAAAPVVIGIAAALAFSR